MHNEVKKNNMNNISNDQTYFINNTVLVKVNFHNTA